MTKRAAENALLAKLDEDFRTIHELRSAIFRVYAEGVRAERIQPKLRDEHTRREEAIFFILHEALDYCDLSRFSATHLETLELAVAYWVEMISAPDAEINAPAPDPAN